MMSGGRRVKRREKRGRVRWHDGGGGKGGMRREERPCREGSRVEAVEEGGRAGWAQNETCNKVSF